MTSRDGSNRSDRPFSKADPAPRVPRQDSQWELDAEDLNRYMSGQPSKQPRFDPYGRSQSSGRTERMPARQPQPTQPEPEYDDYEAFEDDNWVEDDQSGPYLEPESRQPVYEDPAPARRRSQPQRSQPRVRVEEPEYYDEDLYEDPYVLDDDDVPARRAPQRTQRPSRQRPQPRQRQRQRQAPSFTLPPALTQAPIVADRITLGMLGVLLASLVAMVVLVATKNNDLTTIFTHVNANGEPEKIQGVSATWRLPLLAGMVTLINTVLAWFLSRWGMFLPRFLLGGALGVHFIVWIAVFAHFF